MPDMNAYASWKQENDTLIGNRLQRMCASEKVKIRTPQHARSAGHLPGNLDGRAGDGHLGEVVHGLRGPFKRELHVVCAGLSRVMPFALYNSRPSVLY